MAEHRPMVGSSWVNCICGTELKVVSIEAPPTVVACGFCGSVMGLVRVRGRKLKYREIPQEE